MPTIIFAKEYRRQLIAEAYEKGWQNIQDASGTGSGKSHDLGKFSLGAYPSDVSNVFYLTDDAENPTTPTVEENFSRLITRHDGQKYDHSHRTPKGRPHVRRIKPGDVADIPGNCPETQTFLKFVEKGSLMRAGKGSPVCETCPQFNGCGFISERRLQLDNESFLRAHPSQMPTSFKEYEKVIGIWDEPGKIFQVNAPIKFSWMQMQQAAKSLQSTHPKLYGVLNPMLKAWNSALMDTKIPRHGLPFAIVKNLLTVPRFVSTDRQLIDILKVAEQADKAINSRIDFSGIQTPEQKQQWINEQWNPHYFSLIIKAITDTDKRINVSIDQNWNFIVSRPLSHHRKVVEAMAFNIYLDTTLSRGDLAALLGIRKDEILTIEQEKDDFSNLRVNIVRGIGKCGQTRETDGEFALQNRLEKLIADISKKASTTAVIDFKKYANEGAGHWWVDNRGSNAYKDVEQLILVGSPLPNLNAAAAKWQAIWGEVATPTDLTGSFGAWLHRGTRSETVQGVGRLRAQHSNQQKTCWIIGDGHGEALVNDLKKAFSGCTVQFLNAADICPEAAPKGEQRERTLINLVWGAVEAGEKITTRELAKIIGVTQGRISQMMASWGGFVQLKELLVSLVKVLEGKLITVDLSADALFIAREYLPAVASQLESAEADLDPLEELMAIRKAFGHRDYLAILTATPLATLGTFLKWIICSLPPMLLERIRPDEPIAA